ncbi:FAD-dependent oxidoreductase [Candidatus Woesearchaeota archaeon]|nr:FAD-dependent oxidoreductase [Candidatus Woesearchaeota archaeon]
MTLYDVIIIGGGVVGYGTAMYCGRLNLKTLVIEGKPGGTIILTDVVENYPGFIRLTGQELADKVKEHAQDYSKHVRFAEEKAIKVEKFPAKNGHHHFRVHTDEEHYHDAKTVIFATGSEWKKLDVPGEEQYANKGVHYCALCDGAVYQDKVMAIVGGSDSAAKDALVLTQWAKKVYMIYRGEKIRPEPINYERVMANQKIEIIYKTNVKEIKGDGKKVTHVLLDNPYNGSAEFRLDAIFIAIGHIPRSGLAKELGVAIDAKGEIIIDKESRTNIPGVYAAGDVADSEFKQAITGVGEGVKACYQAYTYISKNHIEPA